MIQLNTLNFQARKIHSIVLLVWLISNTQTFANTAPAVIHAKSFKLDKFQSNQTHDIQSYWVSEKLDGVRAIWNGKNLITRKGNIIHAPFWFTEHFPTQTLDGELWLARNRFDKLSGIVRKQQANDNDWKKVSYQLFELPGHSGTFTQRLEALQTIVKQANVPWLQMIKQIKIADENALFNHLNATVKQGGEGLMLHLESSLYHTGRSNDLLKLKPVFDTEAIVISILPGKGKYSGKMGSLLVQLDNGQRFKIGSGFTDKDRGNPPAIGTQITFEYSGLSQNGIPRFARFKRIRVNH